MAQNQRNNFYRGAEHLIRQKHLIRGASEAINSGVPRILLALLMVPIGIFMLSIENGLPFATLAVFVTWTVSVLIAKRVLKYPQLSWLPTLLTYHLSGAVTLVISYLAFGMLSRESWLALVMVIVFIFYIAIILGYCLSKNREIQV